MGVVDHLIAWVTTAQFLEGLRFGVGASIVAALVGLGWRVSSRGPAPVVGLLFAGAGVPAMAVARLVPTQVVIGLLLLALAGAIFDRARRLPLVASASAVPGAWLIAHHSGLPGAAWVPWLVLGGIVAGAPLSARVEADRSDLGPLLFGVTIAGVFLVVPDTEEALVLLGLMAPLVFVGYPTRLARLGSAGAYASLGLLMWAAAWGARGREGSLVGAAGSLGVFLLAPALEAVVRRFGRGTIAGPGLVAVHVILVLLASRVLGRVAIPVWASLVVLVGAVSLGLLALAASRRPASEHEALP